MLGLAEAVRRRGGEIVFVVNGYFKEAVQRCGFSFEELGTKEQFLASVESPDLWDPMRSFRHLYVSLIEPCLRSQYEALERHYAPGRTVAVANCFGLGAFTARDRMGIPLTAVHCQPSVLWSDVDPPKLPGVFGPRLLQSLAFRIGERFFMDSVVGPSFNAFRRELGVAPMRRIARYWTSADVNCCLFPEWFCPPKPD
jgi:rhamnosyltransferase subunit B